MTGIRAHPRPSRVRGVATARARASRSTPSTSRSLALAGVVLALTLTLTLTLPPTRALAQAASRVWGGPYVLSMCARLLDYNDHPNARLQCWGENGFGQLGVGDTDDRGKDAALMGNALPIVDVGTGLTASEVCVGARWSCALINETRQVKCWVSPTPRARRGLAPTIESDSD